MGYLAKLLLKFSPGFLEYIYQFRHGLENPHLLRSGATETEKSMQLPGDELISTPTLNLTRADTISAPTEQIWPWLLQIGHGRGGWYGWFPAFGWVSGTTKIIPELQSLKVGDILLDGPGCNEKTGAWKVKEVIPKRAIVLYSVRDIFTGNEIDPHGIEPDWYAEISWSFILDDSNNGTSRLIKRTRLRLPKGGVIGRLLWLFLGLGDNVMQRTVLQGIKARAERDYSHPAMRLRPGAYEALCEQQSNIRNQADLVAYALKYFEENQTR